MGRLYVCTYASAIVIDRDRSKARRGNARKQNVLTGR